jgi:2-hydroxy-3-keto-5-methylthiopentenyl-1-phosphate phosphatase
MSKILNPIKKIALLCDFDGTISPVNVQALLYTHFANPSTRIINERWDKGEISTKEELEGCFKTITASREEMQVFLDTISLDPKFPDLLNYCHKSCISFAVISDGLKWYIEYILNAHGIEGVTVYANEIIFSDNGFKFDFPWFDTSAPLRGTAKNAITRKFIQEGYFVIVVGDGISDTDAVQYADMVFAKDYLLSYVRSKGIPAFEFVQIADVLHQIINFSSRTNITEKW